MFGRNVSSDISQGALAAALPNFRMCAFVRPHSGQGGRPWKKTSAKTMSASSSSPRPSSWPGGTRLRRSGIRCRSPRAASPCAAGWWPEARPQEGGLRPLLAAHSAGAGRGQALEGSGWPGHAASAGLCRQVAGALRVCQQWQGLCLARSRRADGQGSGRPWHARVPAPPMPWSNVGQFSVCRPGSACHQDGSDPDGWGCDTRR